MKNLLTAIMYILFFSLFMTLTIISVQMLDIIFDHANQSTAILMLVVLLFMLMNTGIAISWVTAEIITKIRWRD